MKVFVALGKGLTIIPSHVIAEAPFPALRAAKALGKSILLISSDIQGHGPIVEAASTVLQTAN